MPTPALSLHTQDLRPQPAPAAEPGRAGAGFANLLALQLQAPVDAPRAPDRRAELTKLAAERGAERRAERSSSNLGDPAPRAPESARPAHDTAAERRAEPPRTSEATAALRKQKPAAKAAGTSGEAKPGTPTEKAAAASAAEPGPNATGAAANAASAAAAPEDDPAEASAAGVQEAIAALLSSPQQAAPSEATTPLDGAAVQPPEQVSNPGQTQVAHSLAEAVAPQIRPAGDALVDQASNPPDGQVATGPAIGRLALGTSARAAAAHSGAPAAQTATPAAAAAPLPDQADAAAALKPAKKVASEASPAERDLTGNAPTLAPADTAQLPQDTPAPVPVHGTQLAPAPDASAFSANLQHPTAAEAQAPKPEPGLSVLPPLASAAPASTAAAPLTAGSPVSSAYLRHAPGQAGFAQELGAQVAVWVREGVQQAQLNLNPAELGPVQVRILLEGQQAQVQFVVEHSQTREALQAGVAELNQALKTEGLSLGRADVHTGTGGASAQGSAAQGQEGRSDSRPRAASSWTGESASADTPQPRKPASRGLLDLYA